MKIEFYGAARTVTGAQFIIRVNGKSILLDCGQFQGRRQESYEKNKNFLFAPEKIDSLILSHAHVDHSGNIPTLVKNGFTGSIYATQPTVELCKIMLKDCAYLQQRDIEWVNKIKAKKNEPLFKPIYTIEDVEASLDLFVGIDYNKRFTVGPGIDITLNDAGHILGSSGILLEIEENGKKWKAGYSGDIGRPNMPIMHDPSQLQDLDILIMETTYGNRLHSSYSDVEEELAQLINQVASHGGKIIIPAFAVGRTQIIIYIIHKLFNENRIPEIPVFVDSPMAVHATEVFRNHLEDLDRETYRVFLQDHEDPFGFRRLKYVETIEESKMLNSLKYPHIIISASGMAEGGRVLHHLKNSIENHKTLVLFVGYAAEHTLARKMIDGEKKVKIFGEEHRIKCRIETLDSFSAHADRQELLKYVDNNKPSKLKHIFLVHGELDQMESFKHALRSKGYKNIHIPETKQVYEL